MLLEEKRVVLSRNLPPVVERFMVGCVLEVHGIHGRCR